MDCYKHLILPLVDIAYNAGQIIMQHYSGEIKVEIKEDESPVTSADLAANTYIVEKLKQLAPEINIVSEEEKNQQFSSRDVFFLVDPLDGTKSYIQRTDEFTVNIGLIKNGMPILGVVYIPAQKAMYYTGDDGAYKLIYGNGDAEKICVRDAKGQPLVVMASKSHLTQETKDYVQTLNVKEFNSAGSSLKFCYVAEGKADIYPRFGPTMEWDTAAAHAVLLAAGGNVTTAEGEAFAYGKPEYRNGFFIAKGNI